MSLVSSLFLALALAICFVPVWLLPRPRYRRAQDFFVASQFNRTRPQIVRNASIAHSVRLAAVGPLFAWGAMGDLWPAIVASTCLCLGIYLIYMLREPLREFLDDALGRDQSITVHAFVARQHGNDPRVRLLAASLTALALCGLLICEALVVAAVLEMILPASRQMIGLVVIGLALLAAVHAIPSGHSGVMHSAQLQLGMAYLGMFGTAVVVLYLHVSGLTQRPPYGTFAIISSTAIAAIMLCYRHSKYIDTDPIRSDGHDAAGRTRRSARLLSRFEKIVNIILSVLLVLIIVVPLIGARVDGLSGIVHDSAATLRAGTRVPVMGLVALCLLPLFYPIVDVANWQRLAATRKDSKPGHAAASQWSAEVRRILRMCAVESALVCLLVSMLGAMAVSASAVPGRGEILQVLIRQTMSEVGVVAFPLLLVFVLAAAISTTSALFSASLCTIRYDVLDVLSAELAPGSQQASSEARAMRRTLAAGGLLGLAFTAGFWAAELSIRIGYANGAFQALVFASCCAQLSLVPLVVGPMIARSRVDDGTVSPGWALAILSLGAASGIAAVVAYVATGSESWLWAAVPASIGAGLLLFGIGWARHRMKIASGTADPTSSGHAR
jgi:hypothetical protein